MLTWASCAVKICCIESCEISTLSPLNSAFTADTAACRTSVITVTLSLPLSNYHRIIAKNWKALERRESWCLSKCWLLLLRCSSPHSCFHFVGVTADAISPILAFHENLFFLYFIFIAKLGWAIKLHISLWWKSILHYSDSLRSGLTLCRWTPAAPHLLIYTWDTQHQTFVTAL